MYRLAPLPVAAEPRLPLPFGSGQSLPLPLTGPLGPKWRRQAVAQAGVAQAGVAQAGAAWAAARWAPARWRAASPDVGVERTVPGTHPKVENLFIFSAGTFRQKLAAIVRLEVQKDEAAV